MIKITFSEKPFRLEVKGHANYDEHGKDIVCSAVSSCVAGGINNFEEIKLMKIKVDDGHILVEAKNSLNKHDEIVFETILQQLRCIEELHPKHVKILK